MKYEFSIAISLLFYSCVLIVLAKAVVIYLPHIFRQLKRIADALEKKQ